ncbi:Glycosyltransferase [hydrothermal vent metagenome]|uniref:Glycosyltransferase n=1 Tax=hydrothermal vent metagenome TaxID=652676 RepID=A0A1W1E0E1_9ZZZZ
MSKLSVDFVHVHYLGFYGLISLFTNKKLIATAWGSDILINQHNLFKKILLKRILKKSQIITYDGYNAEKSLIELGASKGKIHSINFGIDSKKFSKKIGNCRIKQEIGFTNNLTIISTRGFEDIYDVQTLIKAMPIILSNIAEVRLVLVGRGSTQKVLEQLVEQLKLKSAVAFVGLVSNDNLPNLLSNMDIYVSTSLSDSGLACSTAEAMACETPVVVSDSAENDKWIDKQNGFLFPVKNYKKLADILIKLLQDEHLRKLIGRAGRDIIVKNNDYEDGMSRMNKLYKDLRDD